MSTLLDEETVVLDALDFEPTCYCLLGGRDRCGKDATHVLFCVACGEGCGFACIEHAAWVRYTDRIGTHRACGANGLLRDVVRVVPL